MLVLRKIFIGILMLLLIGAGACSWFTSGIGLPDVWQGRSDYSGILIALSLFWAAISTGLFFLIRAIWIKPEE